MKTNTLLYVCLAALPILSVSAVPTSTAISAQDLSTSASPVPLPQTYDTITPSVIHRSSEDEVPSKLNLTEHKGGRGGGGRGKGGGGVVAGGGHSSGSSTVMAGLDIRVLCTTVLGGLSLGLFFGV